MKFKTTEKQTQKTGKRTFKHGLTMSIPLVAICAFASSLPLGRFTLESNPKTLMMSLYSVDSTKSRQFEGEPTGVIAILNEEESRKHQDILPSYFSLTNDYSVDDLSSASYAKIVIEKEREQEDFRRIIKISGPKNFDPVGLFNHISSLPSVWHVEYCGQNKLGFYAVPNEATTPGTFYQSQYYLGKINAPNAWSITTGDSEINVGLIDTGVYANHPELSAGQILSDKSWTLNGTSNSPCDDLNGHGTFNAGLIGATTNNYNGIAGVCWQIGISSLRVDNPNNSTSPELPEHVAAALDKAEEQQIKIVNYSGGSTSESLTLKQAILNYSGLLIVAAGNDSLNLNGSSACYPSSWNLANVISVGASDASDIKCSFSNYGSNFVDLFAPGKDIFSIYHDAQNSSPYATGSGTSYAAPLVTAAAALVASSNSWMYSDPYALKHTILENVRTVSGLSSYCQSGGVLDVYEALSNPHSHSFTDHYVPAGRYRHKCYCECGKFTYQNHQWDFNTVYQSHGTLYAQCIICGGEGIIG